LDSYHTFSFADYYDPSHMNFRDLRVINEDRVQPAQGFGTHPHRDMEIVTYVLEGSLQHRDSMGNGSIIVPGEVQRMSAGSGITHSEFNASREQNVHFLQIWILPKEHGITPSYEQKSFAPQEKAGKFCLVASPDGNHGSVSLHSDTLLYAGVFERAARGELCLPSGRYAWVQVARGKAIVNGYEMSAGDGAALSDVADVRVEGIERSEVLVFDLA
jgi:redox-sensitive bicupin YhaK (pirin superfamily)